MTSFGDTMRECIKFCSACPKQALALALGMIVLSSGDLMEVIPFFGTVVASPFFPFFHETHDLLALGLALYAAYKWHPAVGMGAVFLFLLLHVPYFSLGSPGHLPEFFRILFIFFVASVGIQIISELRQAVMERRRAEETLKTYAAQLEQTKDYLQRLIDTSPIAIITTNLEGKILSFSKGAEKMYGYAAEEVLGRHVGMLQPEGSYKKLNKEMHNKIMSGEIVENELLNVRKNGEVFPVYLYLTSMLDDRYQPIGLLSLAEDITQRKKMEEELKAYAKILETNSAKLIEYAIELKKTNELRDLFTDIMRHDLMNPIGIIKNLTEFLAEEESLKGLWEEVEVLQRNVRKLEEMTESASKLAKIESMEKIEFQRQDLNAILKKVIESFEPVFKEKGMQVEYSAKGEYLARANPVIEDVFLNLISNAIKYSPEKSRIIVGIEDGGEVWKIGVKDHGEGVPDEYKEAIFERFKRGGKEGVKGTGLGLAIVKRAVELHKGKVWVEDNPEGGSVFYVTLPKI